MSVSASESRDSMTDIWATALNAFSASFYTIAIKLELNKMLNVFDRIFGFATAAAKAL